MKRKLLFSVLFVSLLACFFAISAGAVCKGEHSYEWQAETGNEGFFGEITLNGTCTASKCYTKTTEKISPIFTYLGYSYGEGGYTQSYVINREALKKYEDVSGDTVEFGGVATTANAIGTQNPLDKDGNPISSKVKVANFTDTDYNIINIAIKGIDDKNKDTDIVCSLYVKARGQTTYLDNGVEKTHCGASSYNDVKEGLPAEEPSLDNATIISGKRYEQLDMTFSKGAYWSSGTLSAGADWDLNKKFWAADIPLSPEDLPVGSVVILDAESYWQYRIDRDSTRGSYTKTPVLVIDENWWGTTKTASFTISMHTTENASSSPNTDASVFTEADLKNALKIYVPVSDTEDVEIDYTKQNWNDDQAFKVLLIGNSFSQDTGYYAYQASKAMGIENVKIGNLYIGAGSISDHLYRHKHGATAELQTTTDGKWTKASVTLETAVKSDDWDYIVIQQVSPLSGEASSFESANALIDIIEPLNPSARIAWNMTWAYQSTFNDSRFVRYGSNQDTMYQSIISATKSKILTNDKFDVIIPTGTVIQNVRSSYIGDTLTRDGYHLSESLGRQIASLSLVHALTGISVDNVTTANYSILSDAEALVVAIEAINNADTTPFAVTKSIYSSDDDVDVPSGGDDSGEVGGDNEGGSEGGNTGNEGEGTEGGGSDNEGSGEVGGGDTGDDNTGDDNTGDDNTSTEIEGYKQLSCEEMETTRGQYYNSGNGTISKGTNVCFPGFYTVKKYTKETLPVGSKIFLAAGWQYRLVIKKADGSYTNKLVSTDEDTYIEITESWWSNYQEVGFNISAKGHGWDDEPTTDLTAEEVAASKFIIYIPISK